MNALAKSIGRIAGIVDVETLKTAVLFNAIGLTALLFCVLSYGIIRDFGREVLLAIAACLA
jgi:hypothetical protein